MILKPMTIDIDEYPAPLRPYLGGAKLYDSSCSPKARVIFIDKDSGYFLKIAPASELGLEYELTRYFYSKGLSANVAEYFFDNEQGWLLTEKIHGDDCTAAKYLEQPKRLCDTLAERLALLHSLDHAGCPARNHTERYLLKTNLNYQDGRYDSSLFPDNWGYASPEEAYDVVKTKGSLLQTDTLLHGDYCLPNIILDNWRFSGFIDLGSGGVGDRHVDLFWGVWTLDFNLKTDKYRRRFFDAYGRGKVDEEKLRLIAACEVFG
jgi:kanamycin kinase